MITLWQDIKYGLRMLALLCLCHLAAFWCGACNLLAADKKGLDQDTLFPPHSLREDVDFLVGTLCDVHFGLSGATPRITALRSAAEELKAQLIEPLTQAQFFVRLAPLVAGLEDGHTRIHLPSRSIEAYKKTGGTVIPVDVTFLDGRVYLLRNYATNAEMAPGAELLAINGVPVGEIIQRLSRVLSGERETFRLVWLEGKGNDYFKVLLWVVYGFRDTFDVRYQQDGVVCEAQLPGLSSQTLQAMREKSGQALRPFRYLRQGERIGLLEIKTFQAKDGEYEGFLKKTFRQIRVEGIEHLIIDVRGNLGGSSGQAGELLSYLAANPMDMTPVAEVRVSAQAKSRFKKRIPGALRWLPVQNLSSRGRTVWNAPEGSVVAFKEEPIEPKPQKERYCGKVYLLVDEGTFSTAALLADAMKHNGVGLLIGRETGGLAGSTLGEPLFFETPHCGIGFSVSAMRFQQDEVSSVADRRGVVPHLMVDKDLNDQIHGIDTVLEKAKTLISSEMAQKGMK